MPTPPHFSTSFPLQRAAPFSDPFIMAVGPEETVGQLRRRVQQRLEVPDEEFAKWRTLLVA